MQNSILTICVSFFDQFREHNLKLKPSKCNFFKEEFTYLAHWVSKEGVWPINLNLKVITKYTLPQTYTEVPAFLGLVGHYRRFIKGFFMYCTATQWSLNWGRTQQEIQACITFRGCPKGFGSTETGMYGSLCVGLHWLYKIISARDRCVQGWARGSVVPETGRQMTSPSCLWEQSPYASWE